MSHLPIVTIHVYIVPVLDHTTVTFITILKTRDVVLISSALSRAMWGSKDIRSQNYPLIPQRCVYAKEKPSVDGDYH